MVEVAELVFAEHGHEVEYIESNWSRAIHDTRQGRFNAIIGAFRGDAPDFVFPEQSLSVLSNTFFVRQESLWQYEGVESLKSIQLAAIGDYDYGDELRDYIEDVKNDRVTLLSGADEPLKRGIMMLKSGRVDALVEADPVFWYTATRLENSDAFKAAGRASEPMKSYIAFSPVLESSEAFAKLLSVGIQSLRESGKLEAILNKYGLTDWED